MTFMTQVSLHFLHLLPELEPEPPNPAAKVFRPLLCPVWRQEHPGGGDE